MAATMPPRMSQPPMLIPPLAGAASVAGGVQPTGGLDPSGPTGPDEMGAAGDFSGPVHSPGRTPSGETEPGGSEAGEPVAHGSDAGGTDPGWDQGGTEPGAGQTGAGAALGVTGRRARPARSSYLAADPIRRPPGLPGPRARARHPTIQRRVVPGQSWMSLPWSRRNEWINELGGATCEGWYAGGTGSD